MRLISRLGGNSRLFTLRVSVTVLFIATGATIALYSTPLYAALAKAKTKGCEVILAPEKIEVYREEVRLEHPFSQSPNSSTLPAGFIGTISKFASEDGERVTVDFFPNFTPAPTGEPQGFASRLNGNRQVPLALTQQRAATTSSQLEIAKSSPSALALGDDDVLREYVKRAYYNRDLDAGTVEYIVRTLRNDSKFIAGLRAELPALRQRGDAVKLSNEGLNRFFWFQPANQTEVVPARLLDIHDARTGEFIFMVEWITDTVRDGHRVRHIGSLKAADARTIRAERKEDRLTAMQAFLDSLSPAELMTLQLAKAEGLFTFGYVDFRRMAGESGFGAADPMSSMSNLSHLAIRSYIEQRWGSISDLLTPEEAANPNWNVNDVFARLTPRYILSRFRPAPLTETFSWVITEDGQLKIIPHMHKGNNLKPQLLRLAHGRRIFAAGQFEMSPNGHLKINLDANNYQDLDAGWISSGLAFRTEKNGNVDRLVSAAFLLQADAVVESINNQPAPSFYSETNAEFGSASARNANGPFQGFDRQEESDFMNSFARDRHAMKSGQFKDIVWSSGKASDAPIELKAWLKATGRDESLAKDRATLEAWGHYVFGTNPNQSLAEIKMSYRKLVSRFRFDPNLAHDDPKNRPSYVVSDAYKVFDTRYQNAQTQ